MRKISICVAMLGLVTVSAMAQYAGAPIGDGAVPDPVGTHRFSGMFLSIADRATAFGARYTYGATESLALFGDLGLVTDLEDGAEEYEDSFDGVAFQLGAIYKLPVEAPFDLALRGTIFKPFINDENVGTHIDELGDIDFDVELKMVGGSIGALASYHIEDVAEGLTGYAHVGLHFVRTKVEVISSTAVDFGLGLGGVTGSVSDSESDTETDVGLVVGGILQITDRVAAFGEVGHVGDAAVAFGLHVTL